MKGLAAVDFDDFRTLLRAYVALTLARSTAGLYGGTGAPRPNLPAAVNYHDLALRELETVLDRARPEIPDAADSPPEEEECSALLM